MTERQPQTEFLSNLDRQTLDAISARIEKLSPLVAEYNELCRRRRILETRYGLNRTSERLIALLSEYPEGLDTKAMAKMLDRTAGQVRSTASDLVKSGHLVRAAPGVYTLATEET